MITNEEVTASIIDVNGKLIGSMFITSTIFSRINKGVIFDELPAGIYLINIIQAEFSEVKKLIIKK